MLDTKSCVTCAWLSHCGEKCFNPHYVVMSDNHVIPCKPEMFCCVNYENRTIPGQRLLISDKELSYHGRRNEEGDNISDS
jgi:hypothetical protein